MPDHSQALPDLQANGTGLTSSKTPVPFRPPLPSVPGGAATESRSLHIPPPYKSLLLHPYSHIPTTALTPSQLSAAVKTLLKWQQKKFKAQFHPFKGTWGTWHNFFGRKASKCVTCNDINVWVLALTESDSLAVPLERLSKLFLDGSRATEPVQPHHLQAQTTSQISTGTRDCHPVLGHPERQQQQQFGNAAGDRKGCTPPIPTCRTGHLSGHGAGQQPGRDAPALAASVLSSALLT